MMYSFALLLALGAKAQTPIISVSGPIDINCCSGYVHRFNFVIAPNKAVETRWQFQFTFTTGEPRYFVAEPNNSEQNLYVAVSPTTQTQTTYTAVDNLGVITITSNEARSIPANGTISFSVLVAQSTDPHVATTSWEFSVVPSTASPSSVKIGDPTALSGQLSVFGTINSSDITLGTEPASTSGYGAKLLFGKNSTTVSDPLWLSRYNSTSEASELRLNIGDDFLQSTITTNPDKPTKNANADKFSIGSTINSGSAAIWNELLSINSVGNMVVNGRLKVLEVAVVDQPLTAAWPDFVFDKEYNLMKLNKLEEYLAEHKHLPNVPSAKEVQSEGLKLGEMNRVLLQKVEELTLYIIEQQKRIEKLEKAIK